MATAGPPAPVFISYARGASADAARRLQADLAAAGVDAFLDVREIPFGAAFPAALADGVLDARVALVLADERYFERPWCVHELSLITAAWRAGDPAGLAGVLVALPTSGDLGAVTAQLPPPLAAASWPTTAQPQALVDQVLAALAVSGPTFGQRLAGRNDATAATVRRGADLPLPWAGAAGDPAPAWPALRHLSGMPSPRGDGLVGRSRELWLLVHELVTGRAFHAARHVVLRGLGGSGKSLLAAEFVARYSQRFFPAGVVWVDAEAGAGGLADTCQSLWALLAPGEPLPLAADADVPTRLQVLMPQLAARASTIAAGSLLWVVDGLPEPGSGDSGGGIAAWCPLMHHACVLVTTRRGDTLREAHATLPLGPLPAADGLALLTRPPVDARWLGDEEWQAVVRWAGALPLVLALLREGLLDGSLSVAQLQAAPKAEPAQATQSLMDTLRGEVDDDSLRGAADAFGLACEALGRDPALADAALRVALLAPVALPEALLAVLLPSGALGKLVRRGWMQPAESSDAGRRLFAMHRVPASVLRMRVPRPDEACAAVFDGLSQTLSWPDETWRDARVELHVHIVANRCFAGPTAPAPAVLAAATQLALAVAAMPQADARRGLRYLAALLADATGSGAAFVSELARQTDPADIDARRLLPHVLQALPGTPEGMDWYARLLADPDPAVARQAIVHVPAIEPLLQPALQAVLQVPPPQPGLPWHKALDPIHNLVGFISNAANLRTLLSTLMGPLCRGPAVARLRSAGLLGLVLQHHGRQFKAGGFSGSWLVTSLLRLALADEQALRDQSIDPIDEDLLEALSTAAARGETPLDDDAWPTLVAWVDQAAEAPRRRALSVVGHYLRAAQLPAGPMKVQFERDDEGRGVLSGELFPQGRLWPAHVVPQLARWMVDLPEDAALQVAAIVAEHPQALKESSPWVYERLDGKDAATVERFAQRLLAAKPGFINAHWWRGLALADSGHDEAAAADFEAVLAQSPGFGDAALALADACWRIGRQSNGLQAWAVAEPWLARGAALRPDDFNLQQQLALTLYNLRRFDDALAAASKAVALQPDIGDAWLLRAAAQAASGLMDGAWADIERARQLAPDHAGIADLHARLQAWRDCS